MYIIHDGNEIIEGVRAYGKSIDKIKEQYPDLNVVRIGHHLDPAEAKKYLRVYKEKVVKQISGEIAPNKVNIKTDGIDEVEVTVNLFNVQPQEVIDRVIIRIGDSEIPVDIENNTGSFIFSTTISGLHFFELHEPPYIICGPGGVLAE